MATVQALRIEQTEMDETIALIRRKLQMLETRVPNDESHASKMDFNTKQALKHLRIALDEPVIS